MGIGIFYRYLLLLSLFVGGGLWNGCGNEGSTTTTTSSGGGGSGGSGSSVGVSGKVTVPGESSTSVSQSLKSVSASSEEGDGVLNLSKGSPVSSSKDRASEETVEIVTMKVVTDKEPSSGTVKVKTASGKELDSCSIKSGALSGCDINAADLDSTKQVVIVAEADSKKVSSVCDCSSCANGGSINCGTSDSDTTTAAQVMYFNADAGATAESPTSTVTSQIGDGTFKPKEVYSGLKEQLGLSGSVAADNAQNGFFTIKKAIRSGLAAGKITSFADINKVFQGNSTLLDAIKGSDSSLSGVDLSTAATLASRVGGAFFNFFKDSTTASKWSGSTKLESLAKTFGKYDSSELLSVMQKPENTRLTFNQYADDFDKGAKNAFDKMKDGAKAFAEFMEKFGTTAMGSAQAEAAKALFDQMTFSGGSHDKLGASIYAQIKAADSDADIAKIKNNPGQFTATILKNPDALANDDGSVAQQWINQVGTGGTLTGFTPCTANTDCPSGQSCSSTTKWCNASASGKADGSGAAGAVCSTNLDCASNSCVGSVCTFGSGDILDKKLFGQTCSLTSDCINGLACKSGTCGFCGNSVCDAGENGVSCSADCPFAGTYTLTSLSGTCQNLNGGAFAANNTFAMTLSGGSLQAGSPNGVVVSLGSGTSCTGIMNPLGTETTCSSCVISGSGNNIFTFTTCGDCTSFVFTK